MGTGTPRPCYRSISIVADGRLGVCDGAYIAFVMKKGRGQRELLISFLSAVIDPQDFDALPLDAIDGDIGQGRKQKLSGSFLAPGTATMRPLFKDWTAAYTLRMVGCR